MADHDLTCQRCRQPLLQDPSLANINQAQYDLIVGSLPSPTPPSCLSPEAKLAKVPTSTASRQAYLDAVAREQQAKAAGPDSRRTHSTANDSFILLSDSQIGPPPPRPARTPSGSSRPESLSSSSGPSTTPLSTRLYTLLSSRTPVDHPLCTECARILQDSLQAQLEDVQRERDAYIGFERRWASNVAQLERRGKASEAGDGEGETDEVDVARPMTDAAYEAQVKRKAELQKEETEWMARLRIVEDEEEQLKLDEAELAKEEQALEREEITFLQQHAFVRSELADLRASLSTEQTLHLLATQTLARLEATNVYNDVFQIGHVPLVTSSADEAPVGRRRAGSGGSAGGLGTAGGAGAGDGTRHPGMVTPGTTQTVGTINGLRLGGRPWVDWPEINAALGLVALCIDRIAAKVGCAFETYKVVPLGSFSRIDEVPPSKNSYELYASSDMTPARLLQNRRFNYALLGLLDCLRQLVVFGKAHRRGWDGGGLEITKDRINDHPIRLSFGMGMSTLGLGPGQGSKEEESWTRALRAVLAVLKRILVMESEADRDGGQVR